MHKLNYCGTLCLPKEVEGYDAREIKDCMEFQEGYLMPMARPFTNLHALYCSKPVLLNKLGELERFLEKSDLDTKDKVDEVADYAISADHTLDPDNRADLSFRNRDSSLKQIAEKLLSKYNSLIMWTNNGLGHDSVNGEDGIVRYDGIAVASIMDGNEEPTHQRKLPDSYQNSGHQHVHIAPDNGIGDILESIMSSIHVDEQKGTLNGLREIVQENGLYIPSISVARIDRKTNLTKEIEFSNYSGLNCVLTPEYTMSAFVRAVLKNYHLKARGIDFTDKDLMKDEVKRTADFYGEK